MLDIIYGIIEKSKRMYIFLHSFLKFSGSAGGFEHKIRFYGDNFGFRGSEK